VMQHTLQIRLKLINSVLKYKHARLATISSVYYNILYKMFKTRCTSIFDFCIGSTVLDY